MALRKEEEWAKEIMGSGSKRSVGWSKTQRRHLGSGSKRHKNLVSPPLCTLDSNQNYLSIQCSAGYLCAGVTRWLQLIWISFTFISNRPRQAYRRRVGPNDLYSMIFTLMELLLIQMFALCEMNVHSTFNSPPLYLKDHFSSTPGKQVCEPHSRRRSHRYAVWPLSR